jgi:pSer/pThr/pTyr-binding forkhead associated (FHA) protein
MRDPLGPHLATPVELRDRLEYERAGAPFLVFRDGEQHQHLQALADDQPRLTIGRSPDCDIALVWDAQTSRVHAELKRVGGGWTVVDGGLSRNGSYLNGERLHERRRLRDGDVLRFGQTAIVYRQPQDATIRTQSETVLGDDLPHSAPVSPAQRAVLRALCRPFAEGNAFASPATNNQIAKELFLSLDAVKGHLRILYGKFGLDHLPQNEKRLRLVERALQAGVVSVSDLRDE